MSRRNEYLPPKQPIIGSVIVVVFIAIAFHNAVVTGLVLGLFMLAAGCAQWQRVRHQRLRSQAYERRYQKDQV